LLAALIVLGLVVGMVHASDLATENAAVSTAVSVQEADDRAELAVVVTPVALATFAGATNAVRATTQLPSYLHCALVFRPPRASAFV
jgi:hypothetical protein